MIRRSLLLAIALGAVPTGVATASAPPGTEPVPSELLGLITEGGLVNLDPGWPVRVAGEDDRYRLEHQLDQGPDQVMADEIIGVIDDHFPAALPEATTLIVGIVHSGCFAATDVRVERQPSGRLTLVGVADEREGTVVCVESLTSVAVVSVDADDAPAGSTGTAHLVAFETLPQVGTAAPSASELDGTDADLAALPVPADLPPLDPGWRRFAFVRPGCGHSTAELTVTTASIDATVERAIGEPDVDCAQAVWYLAVFDVPRDDVPATAVLAETGW